jgi:nicotinate phosphoribosyltransferase
LSEENVRTLRPYVDGFGVGTAVAYPPVIDFSAKIVEVREDGKRHFRAKRGGLGGRKAVYRSRGGFHDTVQLSDRPSPQGATPLLKPLIREGKIVRRFESLTALRKRTSRELALLAGSEPHLGWR